MELRLKKVTDGLDAFQKAAKTASKRKIVARVQELSADTQAVYNGLLIKYHTIWCELGITNVDEIGRVLAIQYGKLAEKFCCNRYGVGNITTATLVIMYEVLRYYVNAQAQSEKSIANKIQRSILQEYEFNGFTDEDLHNLMSIIAYNEYAKFFEITDLDNRNIIEQFTDEYRTTTGKFSKKANVTPVWHIPKSGSVYCENCKLLSDKRFLYYFMDDTKDCYIYEPIGYRFNRIRNMCISALHKRNIAAEESLIEHALFYLGASERITGKYAETICGGAIQHYNGIMRSILQNYLRKNKDFYTEFYTDTVCKYVRAHLGSVADYLKTVPNLSIHFITDNYIAFSVNQGADITTCIPYELLDDVNKLEKVTSDNFIDNLF